MSPALIASALGGAVAALFFRSLLRLAGKIWAERSPVAQYGCADTSAIRPHIFTGLLLHGKGRSVDDPRALKRRAWEHSSDNAEGDGEHTVYGPYVNDFGKPGFYRVSFLVYGSGFSDEDLPVVILDVIQRPFFMRDDTLIVLGQRVIRARELKSEYTSFDVYCYAAGSGTHEYRCLVIAEYFNPERHTLRFDTIQVHRHIPAWEIM